MTEETTKEEILTAISDFANHTEKRFDNLEGRFDNLEGEVNTIKATMVTKDYLDDKLADLRGDLVIMLRKEDTKVKTLVDVLETQKIISETDAKKILTMEPFPQNL
jgi:DNA polymerase II small subunit/DNA polymerase delta subunit B